MVPVMEHGTKLAPYQTFLLPSSIGGSGMQVRSLMKISSSITAAKADVIEVFEPLLILKDFLNKKYGEEDDKL